MNILCLYYQFTLPGIGFATENRTAAGIDGHDFSIFQDIGSMFCPDNGGDAEGDGYDSRFTRKARFFRYDSAGPFHISTYSALAERMTRMAPSVK